MTRLLLLNKLLISIIFFILLFQNFSIPATTVDIWKKNEGSNKEKIEDKDKKEIIIKSPILSGSIEKITINIDRPEAIKVTLIRIIRRSMRSDRKPTGHWKIAPKVLTITMKIEISKVLSPFVIA